MGGSRFTATDFGCQLERLVGVGDVGHDYIIPLSGRDVGKVTALRFRVDQATLVVDGGATAGLLAVAGVSFCAHVQAQFDIKPGPAVYLLGSF